MYACFHVLQKIDKFNMPKRETKKEDIIINERNVLIERTEAFTYLDSIVKQDVDVNIESIIRINAVFISLNTV